MTESPSAPNSSSSNTRKRLYKKKHHRPKKRKSTQTAAAPAEEWFDIKNIIGERDRNGKREYYVDWEGVDASGRPFEPNWQVDRDVTEEAIYAWEKIKRARLTEASSQSQPNPCSDEDAPTQPSRKRKKSLQRRGSDTTPSYTDGIVQGAARKKRQTGRPAQNSNGSYAGLESEDTAASTSSLHTDETSVLGIPIDSQEAKARGLGCTEVVIELPQDPKFDRSDYIQVLESQSSQRTGQEVREHLQFDFEDISVARSLAAKNHSQRTIPDSQEISDTTNSGTGVDSLVAQAGSQSRAVLVETDQSQSQEPSETHEQEHSTDSSFRWNLDSTRSEIPSHQPEQHPVRQSQDQGISGFTTDLGSTSRSEQTGRQARTHARFLPSQQSHSSLRQASPDANDPGFLTQLPVEFDDAISTSSVRPAPVNSKDDLFLSRDSGNPASKHSHSHSVYEHSAQSSNYSFQAAQIVPGPGFTQFEEIKSHSQSARDFTFDENEVIPETIPRRRKELHSSQNSQALSELDVNATATFSPAPSQHREEPKQQLTDKSSRKQTAEEESEKHSSFPRRLDNPSSQASDHSSVNDMEEEKGYSTPSMETPSATSTPMSARDRLRAVQQKRMAQLDTSSSLKAVNNPNPSPKLRPVKTAGDPNPPSTTAATAAAGHVEAEEFANPVAERYIDYHTPLIGSPSALLPSVETDQNDSVSPPFQPLTDELPRSELTQTDVPHSDATILDGHPAAQISYGPVPGPEGLPPPTTLNPNALSLSIEDGPVSPSVPTDDGFLPGYHDNDLPVQTAAIAEAEEHTSSQDDPSGLLPDLTTGPNEYHITLPLANNMRSVYTDTIREHHQTLAVYNSCFREVPYKPIPPTLASQINNMLTRLFDICDLPPFLETLPSMSPVRITKHVRGTNSKFSFVGEFLERLREMESQKKILILARPGQALHFLNNLVHTEGYRQIEGIDNDRNQEMMGVMVASTADDMSSSQFNYDFDVVIAFDHTFQQERLPPRRNNDFSPKTLVLITTSAIQHINMRISDKLDTAQRQNILILAMVQALEVMDNPDIGHTEPHHVADKFAAYVEDSDEDEEFYWQPREIPGIIFEGIYADSQATQSSYGINGTVEVSNGRKRAFDEVNDEETTFKRPKTSQPGIVTSQSHISDSVRSVLGDVAGVVKDAANPTVEISVERLEALVAKLHKYESDLEECQTRRDTYKSLADRWQKDVEGWTKSLNNTQANFMEALRDRGTFEAQRNAALEESKQLKKSLSTMREENATLKNENEALKSKLSEANDSLLASANPDLARVARMEKECEEAKAKEAYAKNRLAVTQRDLDYLRERYQDASNKAAEHAKETAASKDRIEELSRTSGQDFMKANEIQAQNESQELARQIRELKIVLREREAELNQVKQELKTMKSGRRETRQTSVGPGSPRLGVMSPRGVGRSASTYPRSGAASRGTSPAPAGIFDNMGGASALGVTGPVGNGRYAHLRD